MVKPQQQRTERINNGRNKFLYVWYLASPIFLILLYLALPSTTLFLFFCLCGLHVCKILYSCHLFMSALAALSNPNKIDFIISCTRLTTIQRPPWTLEQARLSAKPVTAWSIFYRTLADTLPTISSLAALALPRYTGHHEPWTVCTTASPWLLCCGAC